MSTSVTIQNMETPGTLTATCSFPHAVDAFLRNVVSVNTRTSYGRALEIYRAWLGQRHPLRIDFETALAYRDHLMKQFSAPATIASYLAAVKSLYTLLKEIGAITINVWALIKAPKVPKLSSTQALSEAEMDLLYGKLNEGPADERMAVHLLYEAALRRCEVVALPKSALQDTPSGPALRIVGKGEKDELVGITEGLAAEIREFAVRDGSAWLFVGRSDSESGHLSLRWLNGVCERLGIHPHQCRHTHITQTLLDGVPLQDVSRTARHADIRTTMRYYDAINRVKQSSARKLREPRPVQDPRSTAA